jgi:hypothetical protein
MSDHGLALRRNRSLAALLGVWWPTLPLTTKTGATSGSGSLDSNERFNGSQAGF